MRFRLKKTNSWFLSPAAAWMAAVAGFVLFGVLFREQAPSRPPEPRTAGRIVLLPVRREDTRLQKWLETHDPSSIARGGDLPGMPAAPMPANAARPDPEQAPFAPHAAKPDRVVFAGMETAGTEHPEMRLRRTPPAFPELPPEIYPKLTLDRKPFPAVLPPALLRRAAAVNAGTVEFRLTAGLLPEERRIAVISSSGNAELDRAVAGCAAGWQIPAESLPATLRIVWDNAGEKEK